MKLKKWLVKNEITRSQFAMMMNVSKGCIAKYLSGERKPDAIKIAHMEKRTHGEVTRRDWK